MASEQGRGSIVGTYTSSASEAVWDSDFGWTVTAHAPNPLIASTCPTCSVAQLPAMARAAAAEEELSCEGQMLFRPEVASKQGRDSRY